MFGLVKDLLKYRDYFEPALEILEALGGFLDGRIDEKDLITVVDKIYDSGVLPDHITKRSTETEVKEAIKSAYKFVQDVRKVVNN